MRYAIVIEKPEGNYSAYVPDHLNARGGVYKPEAVAVWLPPMDSVEARIAARQARLPGTAKRDLAANSKMFI
ncbi:hypothetical protein [Nitrosococcus watsonii]|uniref:Uncharacterized protein n=1 Tax=Nitrosococcus watsoni (strain C-113) TaxID=105559 RepID=D8K9Y3_NITWC|nr:hypothetical protein [Nitrosococcus watsonii]ADJ29341.1 hypothetical protein Nwat_2556 [Nitrosococcus watsonii C-113]